MNNGDETPLTKEALDRVAEKVLNNAAITTAALSNAVAVTDRNTSPQLLAVGKDTAEFVSKTLPKAVSITITGTGGGSWELRPGTIWNGNKMLITATGMSCRYVVDDRLYESPTSIFVRNEWIDALGKGAKNAEYMVWLVQGEIALLEGLVVPWQILFGVTVVDISLTIYRNFPLIREALIESPNTIRLLYKLKTKYPVLFEKLLVTSAKEILLNLPKGISIEDIAFFVGRVLKGLKGLAEEGKDITLKIFSNVVLKVAALVGGLHLPKITIEAIKEAAREHAKELQQSLAEQGLNISEEESRILLEQLLKDQDSTKTLQELLDSLNKIIPLFENLEKSAPWKSVR